MNTPRLIVTGTRHGRHDVWDVLTLWCDAFGPPLELILGGAKGVDRQAQDWATDRRRAGILFPIIIMPADWGRHGEAAGPRRNIRMVSRTEPGDHLIALPVQDWRGESPGTYHCHAAGLGRGLICALITNTRQPWLREMRMQHARHPRWAAA